MPQDVIDRVDTLLACRAAANVALIFANRTSDVIPDYDNDNNNANSIPDDDDNNLFDNDDDYPFDDDDDDPDDDGHIAGVEGYYPPNVNQPPPAIPVNEPEHDNLDNNATHHIDMPADNADAMVAPVGEPTELEPNSDATNDGAIRLEEIEPIAAAIAGDQDEPIEAEGRDNHQDDDFAATMDQQFGACTSSYNLRANMLRHYGHIHDALARTYCAHSK